MRTKLPDIVDPPKPEADEPPTDALGSQQQDPQQALPNRQGGFVDIDDDELLQLQAEAVLVRPDDVPIEATACREVHTAALGSP